jgi:hypothetical protein
MKFIVSEYAILNETVNTDLPNNVGDLVIVSRIKKDSPNYSYDVTLLYLMVIMFLLERQK